MEYTVTRMFFKGFHFLLLAALVLRTEASWQDDWAPNYRSKEAEFQLSSEVFEGLRDQDDFFKLLSVDKDTAFIGARNRVYYMSLTETKNISTLTWEPDEVSINSCTRKGRSECENYIRVLVKKSDRKLYVCGTNAYQPKCRNYKLSKEGVFSMSRKGEEVGTGVCPFDPYHNSTALYTDGKLFSATVADADSRFPLILQLDDKGQRIRTRPRDSMLLNQPHFVSSYDKGDKVVHFFRETAVEHINCGKVVYSRVARVCKKDAGGIKTMANFFTSFFKARLNCSIPGDFPFYFDEIQATSDFGQGNYRPTLDSGDRSDMIYGIFSTPEHSLHGSAICAYRYSDISNVFRGRFKGQEGINHNWLPVTWGPTPSPHPEKCQNDTKSLPQTAISFNIKYPLMDEVVQPQGRAPMLVYSSMKATLTKLAIDWQVRAADGRYYDVLFTGTSDGRVIKSINKGLGATIEPVTIEDIQVVEPGDPVTDLQVLSDRSDSRLQKLMVISRRKVVSIPLYRCERASTCGKCVGLQDPYCVWNADMKKCINAESGIQSIESGKHDSCEADIESPQALTSPPPPERCQCPPEIKVLPTVNYGQEDGTGKPKVEVLEVVQGTSGEGEVDRSSMGVAPQKGDTKVEILVIAVVVSILVSFIGGFLIGYKVQSCRRNNDDVFDARCSTLQRGRNRLSSGDNPYFHTDHTSLAPKQMNYVINAKNTKINSGAEIKPVSKSNKVYL